MKRKILEFLVNSFKNFFYFHFSVPHHDSIANVTSGSIDQINHEKQKWCAWDLNPGQQEIKDGGRK